MNSEIVEAFFRLVVAPDASTPELVSMTLNGALQTGDGLVQALGEICPAGFGLSTGLCLGPSDFLFTTVNEIDGTLTASANAGPASFELSQNYVLDAGLAGSASLTSVELRFTAIPEPGTGTILIGLAGILIARIRAHQA